MHLQNRFSELNRDFIAFVFREQHDSLHGVMIKTVQPKLPVCTWGLAFVRMGAPSEDRM